MKMLNAVHVQQYYKRKEVIKRMIWIKPDCDGCVHSQIVSLSEIWFF